MDTDLPAIWYPHLGPVANAIWWVARAVVCPRDGIADLDRLVAWVERVRSRRSRLPDRWLPQFRGARCCGRAPPGVGGGGVGMVNELRSPPPLSVGADDPPPPHAVATTRTNTAAEPASKRMWFTPMSFRCDGSYVPGQFRNGTQSASALLAVPTHNFIKGPAASGARCSLDQACLCGIAEVQDEFAVLVGGIAKDRAT